MENITGALKIAFAVLVFVVALTVIFIMIGQVKTTTDAVTYYTDKTNFYTWEENTVRKEVNLDQVICSLYNYNKENVRILIYDENEKLNTIFDLAEETKAPWIGSEELIKQRVFYYIYGNSGSRTNMTFAENWYNYWPESDGIGKYPIATKSLYSMVAGKENYVFEELCGMIYVNTNNTEKDDESKEESKLCIVYILRDLDA